MKQELAVFRLLGVDYFFASPASTLEWIAAEFTPAPASPEPAFTRSPTTALTRLTIRASLEHGRRLPYADAVALILLAQIRNRGRTPNPTRTAIRLWCEQIAWKAAKFAL